MILIVVISLCILLIAACYSKYDHHQSRSKALKLKARLDHYKKERGAMRNDYTKLHYPYIKIIDSNKDQLIKLHYANSSHQEFEIGAEIDVFWRGGKLLYWDTYSHGIYKFLPF